MKVSDCCGAPSRGDDEDIGVCSECHEHCEYHDDGDYEPPESTTVIGTFDDHYRTVLTIGPFTVTRNRCHTCGRRNWQLWRDMDGCRVLIAGRG